MLPYNILPICYQYNILFYAYDLGEKPVHFTV